MEQRIEPIIQLENVAGTDPAYVPGLTPQESAEEAEREKRTDGQDGEAAAEESAGAAEPSGEEPAEGRSDGEDEDGADAAVAADATGGPEAAERTADAGDDAGEEADDTDGPSFEVIDPLGAISAGRAGITLRMDGEEVELDWEEIGAVEVGLPRIGRRFTVTVYTVDGPWFRGEVHAPTKDRLKKWDADLDKVLDAYFEG